MVTLALYLAALQIFLSPPLPPATVEVAQNVPILMYHEIGRPEGPWKNLYVSPENFTKQLDFLQENGFHTITMAQLQKNRQGLISLPPKPVVLTFDDGYASMYHTVFPLLQEKGMKAVFYVYPEKFGRHNSLTREEIKRMAAGGMEFGSHSMTHADMTKISTERLHYEITESKKILEEITGQTIDSFCYPAGRVNQRVAETLADLGYRNAVTTQYGFAAPEQDNFLLKRIRISYEDSLQNFGRKITPKE